MLAALYDRIGEPAFSLAFQILGNSDAAEEIVAAVFAQVKGELERGNRELDRIEARVLSLVRQRAIVRRHSDLASQAGTQTEHAAVAIPDQANGRPSPLLTAMQRDRLRRAFSQLPELERTAVRLAFYEGLTQDALAKKLGVTADIVRQKVSEGLQTLRDSMRVAS